MLLNPFSRAALRRAESEETHGPPTAGSGYAKETWNSRLFDDALITLIEVVKLESTRRGCVEIRFSDWVEAFTLCYNSQVLVSPATYAASKKTTGDWYGKQKLRAYQARLDPKHASI